MKKAQILSAIALAFALGVVAPVAGVVTNSASAVSVDAPATTATKAELEAAIKKATESTPYTNYNVLVEAAKADQTTYKDMNQTALLSTLNGAIVAVNDEYTGDAVKTTLDDALAVAVATKTPTEYRAFEALQAAVENKTNPSSFDALKSLVEAAGLTVTLTAEEEAAKDAGALLTAIEANDEYDAYTDLIGAVKTVNDAKTNQTKNVNALKAALTFWGYQSADVINSAAGTKLAADGATGPVAALVALAGPALNATSKAEMKTNYEALARAINVTPGNDETTNGTNLVALQKAYKKATGTDLGTTTPTPDTPATTTTISSENGLATITGKFEAGKYSLDAAVYKEAIAALKDFKYGAYDINLKDAKGNVVNPEGTVTVTIKAPEGIDGTKARVYHVNDEGKLDLVKDSKYDKDAKTFTFTTNHFSIYAVVEDNNVLVPGAGVLNIKDNNASTAVSIMAGIATALTAAGAGIVAYRNARRSKEA